jgi:hypothetical protein
MNYILLMDLLEMRYCLYIYTSCGWYINRNSDDTTKWEIWDQLQQLNWRILIWKYPMVELEKNVMINASFLPTPALSWYDLRFRMNQAIFKGEDVVYTYRRSKKSWFDDYEIIEYQGECITVMNTWDIFS